MMYILKKSYLFILLITLFIMLGIQKESSTIYDYTRKNEIQYITVGDYIDYNIEYFQDQYKFNKVTMYEESYTLKGNIESSISALSIYKENTNQYFHINHRNEIIAKKQGVAKLRVSFSLDEKHVKTIDLGLFVIINDLNMDNTWIGLNESNFYTEIRDNPSGKFYLTSDIPSQAVFKINYFSGTILNPDQYTITLMNTSGTQANQGLFTILDGAYIDGLIIKDSTMKPTSFNRVETVSMGFLAAFAGNSFITNVSVEGNVLDNIRGSAQIVGGLVGVSYGTIYKHVSYSGEIHGDFNQIGGLIGFAKFDYRINDVESIYNNNPYPMIDGAFVIGDISNNHQEISRVVQAFIGNFTYENARIQNGYFDGTIENTDHYDRFPFFYNGSFNNKVLHLYSTVGPLDSIAGNYSFSENEYKEVTFEELTSGEELPGLSMFIFEENTYPKLSYWRLP